MNLGRSKTSRTAKSVAPSDPGSDNIVEQIRRLGELRDAGLLSAEQFRVRRAQLLGRSIQQVAQSSARLTPSGDDGAPPDRAD